MPPLQLTSLLQDTLPHLSYSGRALMSALGCVNGRAPGSQELASWLGFHDRYQLARALKREGLPPMETLGGWTRTLYWIIESQSSGATLRELARREHLDPAVAYRLVRRITGRRWSEMRRAGLHGALLSFRDHCRSCAGTATRRRAPTPLPPASPRPPKLPIDRSRPPPPRRLRGIPADPVAVPGAPFDVALAPPNLALLTRGHPAALDLLALGHPRVTPNI